MRTTVLVGVVGKALEAVTLVLLFTLVPRLLGPSDYGSFAVALSLVTLASAASALGGPTWLSRFVPTVAVADRPGLARALAVRSARWRIGVCVVAALVATVLALGRPGPLQPLACFLVVLAHRARRRGDARLPGRSGARQDRALEPALPAPERRSRRGGLRPARRLRHRGSSGRNRSLVRRALALGRSRS